MTKLTLPAAKKWHSGWGEPAGHKGQDTGWGDGEEVLAAAPGTVVEIYSGGGYNGGWGNRVVISHGGNNYTTYNHLASGSILVRNGQTVSRGQRIATMGNTGESTAKHLHFELEVGGRGSGYRVDPEPYYNKDLPGTEEPKHNPIEDIEDEMFIAVVKDSWYLVVPQGNNKPRAVVLGADSGAASSGLPVIKYTWETSIKALKEAVQF